MSTVLREKSVSTKNASPAPQIVIAASNWSQSMEYLMSGYSKEVHIITACAIEVAIRFGVEMVSRYMCVVTYIYCIYVFVHFMHTESAPL